jgi:parallel beta-helix repeat protein
MRKLIIMACLCAGVARSQTTPSSLLITRIFNITTTWPGECAAGVIDNRSMFTRQNNYHSFFATGTGTWSVTMEFSDASCAGPFSSYGATAVVNQTSNPAIGYGNDGVSYHQFVTFAISGANANTVQITYSAVQNFWLSTTAGAIVLPLVVNQGGTGFASCTLNGFIYGNGTNPLQCLAAGSQYQVAQAGSGGVPAMGPLQIAQSAAVSGNLSATNGGTGASNPAAHTVAVAEGASAFTFSGPGTAGQPLVSGGPSADPTYQTLPVGGGGTGITTATVHGVVVGETTSPFNVTAAGTAGQPLVSGGPSADPTYQTLPVSGGGTGVVAAQGVGDTKVQLAGTNSGTIGVELCNDANGGATTSGCTSALPAATGQLQYLRTQPNTGNNSTFQFSALPTINVVDYNFPAQTPGGSLSIGSNTATLTPCPLGVNGSDSAHYLYVSGGTGTAEATLITGGTCTSNASSGTVIITAANTHTGAWTIQSVAAGISEGLQAACSAGINQVFVPAGNYTFLGQVAAPCNSIDFRGAGQDVTILKAGNATNLNNMLLLSGVSGWTVEEVTFDGNFINQTTGNGVLLHIFNNKGHITVRNSTFTHCGVGAPAVNSTAGALLLDTVSNISVIANRFYSNWGFEVQFTSASTDLTSTLYTGFQIINNTFGSPNLADSQSQTNYWDTYAAGPYSIALDGYADVLIQGNQIYGGQKKNLLGNPIVIGNCRNCTIDHNLIEGLGNGIGVISVTQTSGAITGTNTFFSNAVPTAGDVGQHMLIEGDTTIYQITAVSSGTSITVTPAVMRTTASNLRYKINSTGDAIEVGGSNNVAITNNVVRYTHDNGIDGLADLFFGSLNIGNNYTISGNSVSYNNGLGIYLGGINQCTVTGNSLNNNGQEGSAAAALGRAGMVVDNTSATVAVSNCTIAGNNFSDNQGTPTQQYGLSIQGTQGTGNILGLNESNGNALGDLFTNSATTLATSFTPATYGNNVKLPAISSFFVYGPTCAAATCSGDFGVVGGDNAHYVGTGWDTSAGYGWIQSSQSGVAQQPLKLNPAGSWVSLGTAVLASAPGGPVAGSMFYCTNCTTAATCASGGSGHLAVYNGSAWTCQ